MNISFNPNQRGFISNMPSTGGLLDVYVSLTWTNGARCGDRREVPTLKPGHGGQGCFLVGGHSFKRSLRVLWRHEGGKSGPTLGGKEPRGGGSHKNSPDLAKPQRAADIDWNNALCRLSINLATTLQRLISIDTTFGSLSHRTSAQTLDEDRSKQLFNPTFANLM